LILLDFFRHFLRFLVRDTAMTTPPAWQPAQGTDVPAIVRMAQTHFESEIDTIFEPDPIAYSRNITQAVVNQFYSPGSELILVAARSQGLAAYTWVIRGQRAVWSDEEMAVVRMAHVDITLPVRERIYLVRGMIDQWQAWAQQYSIPILCSTTMRGDQSGFMRLHESAGWSVRGSYAYLRVTAPQVKPQRPTAL
jgi:hypothetical protein